MKKVRIYVFLWIAGAIILFYVALGISSGLALDINLHDTYFVIGYNFLAAGFAMACIVTGFVLWAMKINRGIRAKDHSKNIS